MPPDERLRVAYFENSPDYDRLVITYLTALAIETDYRPNLSEDIKSKETGYNAIITEIDSKFGARDQAGLERAHELQILGLPIIVFTSQSVDKASERDWRSKYNLGENVVFISQENTHLVDFAHQVKTLAGKKR